jgi:coproporphyrinogen III oxidase
MKIDEFVDDMKHRAAKGLLEVSDTGRLSERTWAFPKGHSEIKLIRGGAIEKAAIQHMRLYNITIPGISGEHGAVVFQMEVFPENPYCPMGHFNVEWTLAEPQRYTMNLDLFPAIRVEEDLQAMKAAMDKVADRFGRDREKMREMLDTQYNMEHFATPLATKVGCKFRGLKGEELDLLFTAYETFLPVYIGIISKRKTTPYTERDKNLKLERNGKWLEYLLLKDGAIKAARDQGVPPEVLIEQGLPPVASF